MIVKITGAFYIEVSSPEAAEDAVRDLNTGLVENVGHFPSGEVLKFAVIEAEPAPEDDIIEHGLQE